MKKLLVLLLIFSYEIILAKDCSPVKNHLLEHYIGEKYISIYSSLDLKEANEKIEEVVEQQPALPAKQGLMSKPEVKEE